MIRECKICGGKYDYCPSCAVTKNVYKNSGYCGKFCYDISMILQRYGCNVSTASEVVEMLKPYDVDKMSLKPKIDQYYKNIVEVANTQKPKSKPKIKEEIIPQEDVEVVVVNDEDTTISEKE